MKTSIQTNKDEGFLENAEMLAKTDKIVTEEKELSMTTNINIVERSCGTTPTKLAKEQEIEDNKKVEVICKSFANYDSIKAIK